MILVVLEVPKALNYSESSQHHEPAQTSTAALRAIGEGCSAAAQHPRESVPSG